MRAPIATAGAKLLTDLVFAWVFNEAHITLTQMPYEAK
jgi:hypothetical protein